MRTRALEEASGQSIDYYVAIGGGAGSPLWRQMLADASNKPVLITDTLEASALGAGMTAAFGAGWFSSIAEAAAQMAGHETQVIEPHAWASERYGALLARKNHAKVEAMSSLRARKLLNRRCRSV